jgi:hypothetical protein
VWQIGNQEVDVDSQQVPSSWLRLTEKGTEQKKKKNPNITENNQTNMAKDV